MAIEKRGERLVAAVMAELRKRRRVLKARRAFTLEGSVQGDVAQIERESLGVAELREECLIEEDDDMNHLLVFHTYSEYMELHKEKGINGIAFAWGVDVYALKKWVKKEKEKMVKIEEQAATIAELEAKNASLQEQLHGYESHANGLQIALDATEQQLQVRTVELIEVQKELSACRQSLTKSESCHRRLQIAFDEQVQENKELEQQHDVLKQVAKPLLEQLVESL